jgi:quinol monooxygenase YgiN
MIALAITYVFMAGHEEEAVGYFRELIPASRREPGCRMYVVHRAKSDPAKFFIYEQYDDEAAFDFHRSTPHFERYGKNGIQKIAVRREPELYIPLAE